MCWVSMIPDGSGEGRTGGSGWGLNVDEKDGVGVGLMGGSGWGLNEGAGGSG